MKDHADAPLRTSNGAVLRLCGRCMGLSQVDPAYLAGIGHRSCRRNDGGWFLLCRPAAFNWRRLQLDLSSRAPASGCTPSGGQSKAVRLTGMNLRIHLPLSFPGVLQARGVSRMTWMGSPGLSGLAGPTRMRARAHGATGRDPRPHGPDQGPVRRLRQPCHGLRERQAARPFPPR